MATGSATATATTTAADEDIALLDRWRTGDADAGNELFERHFDAVHRFFVNKCPMDAADLVQRTFLAAVEARDRFRAEASVRTFLFAIAHHQLYANFREKHRRDGATDSISSIADDEHGPYGSSLLVRVGEERALLDALRRLPLDLQVALELFYWEGLHGPELAEVLGVPEGTVRSRLRRGIDQLRESLHEAEATGTPKAPTQTTFDGWARNILKAVSDEPHADSE